MSDKKVILKQKIHKAQSSSDNDEYEELYPLTDCTFVDYNLNTAYPSISLPTSYIKPISNIQLDMPHIALPQDNVLTVYKDNIIAKEAHGGKVFYKCNLPTVSHNGQVYDWQDLVIQKIFYWQRDYYMIVTNFDNQITWIYKIYYPEGGGSFSFLHVFEDTYIQDICPFVDDYNMVCIGSAYDTDNIMQMYMWYLDLSDYTLTQLNACGQPQEDYIYTHKSLPISMDSDNNSICCIWYNNSDVTSISLNGILLICNNARIFPGGPELRRHKIYDFMPIDNINFNTDVPSVICTNPTQYIIIIPNHKNDCVTYKLDSIKTHGENYLDTLNTQPVVVIDADLRIVHANWIITLWGDGGSAGSALGRIRIYWNIFTGEVYNVTRDLGYTTNVSYTQPANNQVRITVQTSSSHSYILRMTYTNKKFYAVVDSGGSINNLLVAYEFSEYDVYKYEVTNINAGIWNNVDTNINEASHITRVDNRQGIKRLMFFSNYYTHYQRYMYAIPYEYNKFNFYDSYTTENPPWVNRECPFAHTLNCGTNLLTLSQYEIDDEFSDKWRPVYMCNLSYSIPGYTNDIYTPIAFVHRDLTNPNIIDYTDEVWFDENDNQSFIEQFYVFKSYNNVFIYGYSKHDTLINGDNVRALYCSGIASAIDRNYMI